MEMIYSDTKKIMLPKEFPEEEFSSFIDSSRSILLANQTDSWKEFSGASNIIGWRFRTCYEEMMVYINSWNQHGENVDFEELYLRERALFGMFSSGVSSMEGLCYAIYALASHPMVLGVPFGVAEQRKCNFRTLTMQLEQHQPAGNVVSEIGVITNSQEWKFWLDLRNRMTHRSNIPRVTYGAVGSSPAPAKALQFAATTSSPAFEEDVEHLQSLYSWLASSLESLLKEVGKFVDACRENVSI